VLKSQGRSGFSKGALVPCEEKSMVFHLPLNHSSHHLETPDLDEKIHPEQEQ
jgi:hypothetical protein